MSETLLWALGALWAIGTVWFAGRTSGRRAEQRKADAAYRKAREKMDEVDVGDDPAVAREWLRERGK
jgi:hypothetical protein